VMTMPMAKPYQIHDSSANGAISPVDSTNGTRGSTDQIEESIKDNR
jgi:hypothetical protein